MTDEKDLVKQRAGLPSTQVGTQMGRGFEDGIDQEDVIIPRVKVLEAQSPEVNENPKVFEPGQLINSISKEIYSMPLRFVPIFKYKEWIKWIPRKEGGGIEWRSCDRRDPRVIKEGQWTDGKQPAATPYLHFFDYAGRLPASPFVIRKKFLRHWSTASQPCQAGWGRYVQPPLRTHHEQTEARGIRGLVPRA